MTMRSPQFIFIVPLISRALADAWDMVSHNLDCTLRSALGNEGARIRVVVAHHEMPDSSLIGDPRVITLSAPFEPNIDPKLGSYDKHKKRNLAASFIRNNFGESYIMFLDADDLVHRNLASSCIDARAHAYTIANGYQWDLSRNIFRANDEKFHHSCGSSFVGYFSAEQLPKDWDDYENPFFRINRKPHRSFGEVASREGKECRALSLRACVYKLNHPASLRGMKMIDSGADSPIRGVSRKNIFEAEEASGILAHDFSQDMTDLSDFGLNDARRSS